MSLPELCIRHKAAVAILTAVAFLAGILSWREMNQELIPNISMPTIYIAIPYEGASADQINDKITKILENEFSTMPNLTEMTATNFSGVALMLLTFDDSIDLYTKILDVREVINQNKSRLPEDIREPIIAFGGATDIPIFSFAIISDSDFEELVRFAEEELIPELSHLHGVAEVEIDGYKRRQVDITLRMDDLSANGVSALEVFGALSTKSVSIPAGYATFQKKTVSLKTVSESADLEEIRNIIVGSANGAPIYLENVADVELRYNEKSRDITTDGKTEKKSSSSPLNAVRTETPFRLSKNQRKFWRISAPLKETASIFKRLKTTVRWSSIRLIQSLNRLYRESSWRY